MKSSLGGISWNDDRSGIKMTICSWGNFEIKYRIQIVRYQNCNSASAKVSKCAPSIQNLHEKSSCIFATIHCGGNRRKERLLACISVCHILHYEFTKSFTQIDSFILFTHDRIVGKELSVDLSVRRSQESPTVQLRHACLWFW